MNYRRLFIPNSFIFLTIVTSKRRPILINNIKLLRRALRKAVENYNCKIIAICVLPEHIHRIIKPYQINDYPYFVKQFKTYFSTNIDILTLENYELTNSNINKKGGRLGFQPNNFLSAKTVQFCARLVQKCAKKCKKRPFSSSLNFDSQLPSNRHDLIYFNTRF